MLLVKAHQITFKYQSQLENILEKVSFRINSSSQIGIVGKNGSGKSTLFQIILGDLSPTSGHIEVKSGVSIGYLAQAIVSGDDELVVDYLWRTDADLFEMKKKVDSLDENSAIEDWEILSDFEQAGGYNFTAKIEKEMAQVGLDVSFLDRGMSTLSGGEKTKVGLLGLLIRDPDLLLFDEPTNHLDIVAMRWFKSFLSATSIPYVIISHDKSVLNEYITEIWNVEKHQLTVYSGNYDFFKDAIEQARLTQMHEYETQQKKVAQLEASAVKQRAAAGKMDNYKDSRSVKKNGGKCKRDAGAGSGKANAKKNMNAAKSVERRIEKLVNSVEQPRSNKKRNIILPIKQPCVSDCVVNINAIDIAYNDNTVISDLSLIISKGDRLAIVGANGSGKTSLIKALSNSLPIKSGEIKWAPSAVISTFYQENIDLNANNTILEEVWEQGVTEQHFARTILNNLGLTKKQIAQKIGSLSSGEKVKVSLAKTVLSGANVLILDEPTNHLEIAAIEMLENALNNYEGTVIFVSHNESFIKSVATKVYDISTK